MSASCWFLPKPVTTFSALLRVQQVQLIPDSKHNLSKSTAEILADRVVLFLFDDLENFDDLGAFEALDDRA